MSLNIKIEKIDHWSSQFFQQFVDVSDYFSEKSQNRTQYLTLSDLRQELLSPYFIKTGIKFRAIILRDEKNNPLGQVIVYHKPCFKPERILFGHINFIDSKEVFALIENELQAYANEMNAEHIRGPIQGHFFFSYRLKLGGGANFYGEPQHPLYYAKYLKGSGFEAIQTWETSKLDVAKTRNNFSEIRRSGKKKSTVFKDLKIKYIFPWRWDQYLKYIHRLFLETYKEMDEFEPLDFDTFRSVYNNYQLLINPFFSYLIFYKNEPVGFGVNFFDPLHVVQRYKGKKSPNILDQIILFLGLIFNRQRLLITYVGKLSKINGEDVRGIQSLVSKHLGFFIWLLRVKDVFVCFRSSNSPAHRSFNKSFESEVASYGLLEKSVATH